MVSATSLELARGAVERGAAQKVVELAGFLELIRDWPLRTVVEIGTLRGGTLWALAQVAHPAATIISVDLPGGEWGGGYTEADIPRLQSFMQPEQQLHLLRGDSHDPAIRMQVAALCPLGVDLLFIDGDHSYEGVKADYADYEPLVLDDGLIAFHDVLPHPDVPGCDVDRFWSEVKALDVKSHEFTDPDDHHPVFGQWGGIGVIEV